MTACVRTGDLKAATQLMDGYIARHADEHTPRQSAITRTLNSALLTKQAQVLRGKHNPRSFHFAALPKAEKVRIQPLAACGTRTEGRSSRAPRRYQP